MDAAALTGAYTGVKFARDTFGALLTLKIDSESLSRVHDALSRLGAVQDTLFEIRDQLSQLQTKNEELARALARLEAWESIAARYTLSSAPGGGVVYAAIDPPMHFACPSCFGKRELHILQPVSRISGEYACPGCRFQYRIATPQRMPPMRADSGGIV